MKRILDISVSSMVLVLGAPLLAAIAFMVWACSGRPIFFSQARIGRNFVPFRLIKFRSMTTHAGGPAITSSADPRVTGAGRWLRAWKLDELPQFWNVLKGDMSLVGPRPELPEYVALYRERYRKILSVRPGITDLASITFRNEEQLLGGASNPEQFYRETVLPQKLGLAEQYVTALSLRLDLRILLATAWAVARR